MCEMCEQSQQERPRLLDGLEPFYHRRVEEPYDKISMIKALSSLLVCSQGGVKSGYSFPINDEEISWIVLLMGNLAREVEENVDAIFEDTSVVWKELEQRALDFERQVAALNGDQGHTAG